MIVDAGILITIITVEAVALVNLIDVVAADRILITKIGNIDAVVMTDIKEEMELWMTTAVLHLTLIVTMKGAIGNGIGLGQGTSMKVADTETRSDGEVYLIGIGPGLLITDVKREDIAIHHDAVLHPIKTVEVATQVLLEYQLEWCLYMARILMVREYLLRLLPEIQVRTVKILVVVLCSNNLGRIQEASVLSLLRRTCKHHYKI